MKHSGFVVLHDGKVLYRNTVVITCKTKVTVEEALVPIIKELDKIVDMYRRALTPSWDHIDVACVEQVGWYGRGKSITLPLSHVAGAIVGFLVGAGVPTYFLYANQKTAAMKFARKRSEAPWDEHQKDAAVLAKVAWEYELAKARGDTKELSKRAGVRKHWIDAPATVT